MAMKMSSFYRTRGIGTRKLLYSNRCLVSAREPIERAHWLYSQTEDSSYFADDDLKHLLPGQCTFAKYDEPLFDLGVKTMRK